MNIKLPIESVDSLVDIVLGKRTNISHQRDAIDNPPKITYTIWFTNLDTPPWVIHIHPMGAGTEITFPVRVQRSHVAHSSAFGGSTIEVLSRVKPLVYNDPIDKAKHNICHFIYIRLMLEERERLNNDPSRTQPSEEEKDALKFRKTAKKFRIRVERLKRWYRISKYKKDLDMTNEEIAEKTDMAVRTIAQDFHDMKEKEFPGKDFI